MDQTLKFAYIVFLFVSLFIGVVVGGKLILILLFCLFYTQSFINFNNISLFLFLLCITECATDEDCYKKYVVAIHETMTCLNGLCGKWNP
jgi:hypothetical protein